QIAYYYFIQYHLYRQLRKSVQYAHENGIILKGDIPIGVYRHSCDAWISPELYHLDQQAGAPPDPFAETLCFQLPIPTKLLCTVSPLLMTYLILCARLFSHNYCHSSSYPYNRNLMSMLYTHQAVLQPIL